MNEWSSVYRTLQARRQGETPGITQETKKIVAERQPQTVQPESKASTGERVLATVGDFFGNIITGAAKGIEGIIDLGASVVGGIGGLFDKDFQNNVQDWVSNDWVGENIGNPIQEGTKASYLNDSKAGEIIEGIASGVGQMLPSIALTVATGGAAAPGMAVMAASAAGNATEEAYNQGAGYGQGLAYGLLSGGVEAATEKIGGFVLGGGTSLIGKKLAGTALGKATSKGIGKVAETFVSEGAEEVLSDLANPALKYVTGVDKNIGQNYIDAIKGLPETFVIGGGAGAVLGGGQNFIQSARNKNRGGANATRADAQLAYAQELTENYGDDIVQNKRYDNAVHQIYEQASEEIKKMKPEQRQKYLRSIGSQSLAFNEDGSLRAKQAIDYNTEAMTASLRPVSGNLTFAPVQSNVKVTDNAKKIKGVIEGVKQGAKVVVTDNMPNVEGYDSRAAYIPSDDVFYINNDVKADDPSVVNAIALHELTHKGEGTKAYNTLVGEVSRLVNDPNAPDAIKVKLGDYETRLAETKQAYADQGSTTAQNEYVVQTEMMADYMGDLLSDEYFVRKLGERNKSVTKRILSALEGLARGENKNVDPSVKKGLRKLYKAYINTLDRAGYGVLVSEIDKEEIGEERGETTLQIDTARESRYNKNSLIHKTFPSYQESGGSEANTLAVWWAHRASVLVGDRTAISYNGSWYLIEKFDSSDLGYQIIAKLTQRQYQSYMEERTNGVGKGQSIQKGVSSITSIHRRASTSNGGVVSDNSVSPRNGRGDSGVQRVDQEQSQRGKTASDRGGDSKGGSASEQNKSSITSVKNNSRTSKKDDGRHSLARKDSEGKVLSQGQHDFFKDSKAVDEEGRLLRVYHGSKASPTVFSSDFISAGWLAFGKGFYFTEDKTRAQRYGQSSLYECYLNIKNPFISNDRAHLDLLYEKMNTTRDSILKYSEEKGVGGGELYKINYYLDDRGDDVSKYIRDLGFDGVIVDAYGTKELIVYESNQIKLTTNHNPTKSEDIRFSLKANGENISGEAEIKGDLVALHNLDERKLMKVLELGGFPMPSIAITRTSLGHDQYGKITVVFGRETIDPQRDSRNVVYDRDAWTPTTPIVDVKLSNQGVDDLIAKLQEKAGEQPAYKNSIERFFDGKYRDNNGDYIVRDYDYTKEAFGDRALQNSGIMAAYLNEKGIEVEPVYVERGFTLGWESYTRDEAARLFDQVGITKDVTRDNATKAKRQDILEKYIDYSARRRLARLRRFAKNTNLTIEEAKETLRSEYDDGNVSQLFIMAEDFFNENRPKDVYNEQATIDKMQDKIEDKQDFYEWFWQKIESVYEKKGIDNDSDIFDSRGNRRSFEKRHFAYTAANIVKAMSKGDQEGKAALGMTAGALAAKLSKKFESIEDIRDAKEYLALVSEEDLQAFNDRTYEIYDELVTAIAGRSSDFMSDSARRDDVGAIIAKCATAKPLTVENIKRIFEQETKGYNLGYKFNDKLAEQALLLFESLKHVPTTYFEAKPRRAVGLDEIKAVLLPNTASERVKTALTDKGIQYTQYDATDVNARREIIEKMENVRFSKARSFQSADEDIRYSIRTKEPPKKTITAYKVFYAKDGGLYPPMVANPGGEPTPVGVWLDADVGEMAGTSATGRLQVKSGGKGTQGRGGKLAFRPGWHLGEYPKATQFNRLDPKTGKRDLFPKDFVWARCEIAADVDYQSEAESYGYTENGKYRHSYAGLPKVPEDGYYVYRTNPDPTTVPWYITGAMRVVEILDDNDVRRILQEHGQEPVQRQGGDIDLAQYGLRRGTVDNLRLSRKRNRDDRKFYYEMSKGEIKKLLANNTRMRVYAKKDIEQIINTVLDSYMSFGDKYGTLSNKNKAQVVDSLWQALNTAEKGKVGAVAIDAAEFIINSAVAEEMYEDYDRYEDVAIVNILRPYLNRINLDGIKGELLYRYDKEGFRAIRGRWGKRSDVTKFGIAPDELKLLLEDEGFRMEAEHPADVLAEVDSQYTNALARLKAKSKELFKDMLSAEEMKKLRQDITREILIAADEKGAPSKLSKILEKYKKQLDAVKRRYDEVRHKNGAVNLLLDRVQKIKDIKSGAFLNATQYKSDLFKGSIEKLGRIKYRGNLNRVGTRKIFAALSEWYNAGNPMFKGMDGDQNGLRSNGVFNQEIKDMLDAIAQNEKPLTAAQEKTIAELEKKSGLSDYAKLAEWYTRANVGTTYSSEVKRMLNELARPTEYSLQEVYAMQKIVQYFTHIIETYNMVLKNGKYVDAKELATRYIEKAEKAKKVKTGVVDRIVQSRYGQAFMDPLSIMRNADRYDEHGFFTETFFELQEGIIRSQKLENDLKKDFEEFFKSHKKYAQDLSERKVKYNGVEMSLDEALSLYMTLNREQAQAGLVYSGLSFEERSGKRLGKQSKPVHVKGLVGKDVTGLTPEEIEQTAKAARDDLAKQFNETDMQFVAMLEKALNEDCKEIKRKTDTQRMGYSNVQEGYYYPIRRGYVASNVDSFNAQFEIDRVSNASFNKDTVKGAKGELYIEPVTRVFERHVRGIAQYAGLSTFIDNYNMLYNIDIGDNPNNVNNIRKTAEEVWKNNSQYIIKMLSDAQGIRKLDVGDKIIQRIRGAYVKFALGANPKVWLTQTTSLLAATSVLDVKNVVKGLSVKGADVDTYCDLAEIRNHDNTIALAQGVIDSIGKVGDFLMKPIGMVDRWVVKKLFGACQYQIQQNGGAKVGTVENKKEAGELLTRVILQTQQNSMVTERSSAMRSNSEVARTLTMFTSDAMKVIGRVVDAIGEYTVLKKNNAGADKMKAARRKTAKAVAALVSTSVFMALIAQAFRTLYNKDDEDENIAENMAVDMLGNMLGGLPLIKDVYARLMEGYEVSNYAYSTINNLLDSANNIFQAASDWISGDVDSKQTARNIKNMIYAAGQLLGIPVRNIYNVFDGLISRFSASSAYKLDDLFYNQSYSSDLRKAIEEDDDEMASTIIGLMLNENIGDVTNENVRTELDRLVKSGHDVIPRSAPNSITYEGEEITLTAAQKRDFKQVYSEANNELASLVRLSAYRSASDDVKAKAVDIVYEMYYDLAVEDLIGEDLETKTVLFSKAFDIGKLALIVAQARLLTADKDDLGRSINGTKKAKIQSYINSLNLSAAEKYMIMGYLGYSNTYGEAQVQRYLRGIRGLTSTQRQRLLEYSGYAA